MSSIKYMNDEQNIDEQSQKNFKKKHIVGVHTVTINTKASAGKIMCKLNQQQSYSVSFSHRSFSGFYTSLQP